MLHLFHRKRILFFYQNINYKAISLINTNRKLIPINYFTFFPGQRKIYSLIEKMFMVPPLLGFQSFKQIIH